jgi:Rad3-related DNA helicase
MSDTFLDYFQEGMDPRDVQVKALKWVDGQWDKSRVLALSLSCGAGKSHFGMALCNYNQSRGLTSAYITPQKMLQSQLLRDFEHINMLQGAENYPCILHPKDNVATARCLDLCKKCCEKDRCPYFIHKSRAYNEYITIFNPMSYLFLRKQMETKEGPVILYEADTIILDECQAVASMLSGSFDFKVWKHEYRYKKGISSSVPSLVDSLKDYGDTLLGLFNSDLKTEERMKIQRTLQRLDMCVSGLKKDASKFVVEETEEKYRNMSADCLKVRVTAPPSWVLKWFFGEAKHIILMSGTLFKNTPRELGFDDYQYLDLPSPISPDRRRFIPLACTKNSHSNTNAVAELGEAILKLAGKHPNERGIVLASYEQAKSLKGYLGDNKRFVFHDKKDKADVVKSYMSGTGTDTIAVLSGSWEGLDAKDDLCRFIIITKCLYPNIGDAVVKRKMDQDKEWLGLETMKTVIQGANRATRHEKDFSVVYMLDSNFTRLYTQTKKHLPLYFLESIKWGKRIDKL